MAVLVCSMPYFGISERSHTLRILKTSNLNLSSCRSHISPVYTNDRPPTCRVVDWVYYSYISCPFIMLDNNHASILKDMTFVMKTITSSGAWIAVRTYNRASTSIWQTNIFNPSPEIEWPILNSAGIHRGVQARLRQLTRPNLHHLHALQRKQC